MHRQGAPPRLNIGYFLVSHMSRACGNRHRDATGLGHCRGMINQLSTIRKGGVCVGSELPLLLSEANNSAKSHNIALVVQLFELKSHSFLGSLALGL